VALVGVGSSGATAHETDDQDDGQQVLAEGTSGYVTSDDETPDWFTLDSAGGAKWDIGDFTKQESQMITPQDHLNCSGDQLDWGGTVEKWGQEFVLHLDHCAGSCNWDFEISALNQTYSVGMADDCNGEESFTGGVKPLQVEIEVDAHGTLPALEPVDYWDIDIAVEYYNPANGWQDATWSFTVENPA